MDERPDRDRDDRFHDPTRVLTLSDGVFAIILTLLVLELHVPDIGANGSLSAALHEIRPSFVAFLISFAVVASAWLGHRDLFALIRRTDRPLVLLNLVYLLPLSLIPFGASLLARYQEEPVALRLYGVLLVFIAGTRLVIWTYATRKASLLWSPVDEQSRRVVFVAVAVPGAAYAVACLIAGVAPLASLLTFAVFPVVYFLIVARARRRSAPGAAERDFT
jgi:uncharacterized membrane protein